MKKREVDEAKQELNMTMEMGDALKQRIERLKETRDYHFNKAFEDYMEFKSKNDQMTPCDKDEVISEMKELWKVRKQQEQSVIDLRNKIKQTSKEIKSESRVLAEWNEFVAKGRHELDTKIMLLSNELNYMEENYVIISSKYNLAAIK